MLPKGLKKSFNNGLVIPGKMRFCNEKSKEKSFDSCIYEVNENKESKANLNLLKSQAPNPFGHMPPYGKM